MSEIQANYNELEASANFKFRYRKDKFGNQRPTIEFEGKVPSVPGIIAILEAGGPQLKLLQDAMYEVVAGEYRSFLLDNEEATASSLDPANFTWEVIANRPREDRRASAITAELWEAWAKDFMEIMPGVTNKHPDSIAASTTAFLKKFTVVRTQKPILRALKGQLALYMQHSPNAEEFQDILELLSRKADLYLNADETDQLIDRIMA